MARLSELALGGTSIVLATGVILATVPRAPRPSVQVPRTSHQRPGTQLVDFGSAPSEGSATSRAGVLEFVDFECPYCGEFARLVQPRLEKEYVATGQLLWAIKLLPLKRIHPLASKAAHFADCANRQGRFWPMYHALFDDPADWANGDFSGVVDQAAISGVRFRACLAWPWSATVAHDVAQAAALGIRDTPTFLIGRLSKGGSALDVTAIFRGLAGTAELEEAIQQSVRGGG